MAIIRVTRTQIDEAAKAFAAALDKDQELRAREEQRQRRALEAVAAKRTFEARTPAGKETSL
jgi:hypothetical protein